MIEGDMRQPTDSELWWFLLLSTGCGDMTMLQLTEIMFNTEDEEDAAIEYYLEARA